MNLDLVVCPGCRTLAGDRLDVRTMQRAGDLLVCECGRRYPILDGVPVVLADPSAYVRNDVTSVIERDVAPEVAAALAEGTGDDAPYARLLEHLSIYLDAHWGDRAVPAPEHAAFGMAPFVAKVAERSAHRVAYAVELGCSVGRITAELAAGADHVVGLDLHAAAVRRAHRLLAGETVGYARRQIGTHYAAATTTGARAIGNHTLLCADALDPPLLPMQFGRVVALNLLDSVSNPLRLLNVIDGLCQRGGEILLSSPYAWQSAVVDEAHRFGGGEPAAELVRILTGGIGLGAPYVVEDAADLTWTLRRDARSSVTYRAHYVRARKQT